MSNEEKIKEIEEKYAKILAGEPAEGGLNLEETKEVLQEYGQWVRQQTLEEAVANVPQKLPAYTEGTETLLLNDKTAFEDGFDNCRYKTLSNLQALKDKNK